MGVRLGPTPVVLILPLTQVQKGSLFDCERVPDGRWAVILRTIK